jgi:hypothetical protein
MQNQGICSALVSVAWLVGSVFLGLDFRSVDVNLFFSLNDDRVRVSIAITKAAIVYYIDGRKCSTLIQFAIY